ncbi:MAG: putative toxin-antitoxin system toxin component, PIN family [Bacteroidota bacterium]
MIVILDTNVLLVSISSKSADHPIFSSLIQGEYSIAVSTDILLEYEEKIEEHMGKDVAGNTMKALLRSPFVYQIPIYYFWQLLSKDPDDNKFTDCAVAANADYLVTDDNDFKVLSLVDFPKIQIISKPDFLALLEKLQ